MLVEIKCSKGYLTYLLIYGGTKLTSINDLLYFFQKKFLHWVTLGNFLLYFKKNCCEVLPDSYTCREIFPGSFNSHELLPDGYSYCKLLFNCYNCRELLPDSYKCRQLLLDSYHCHKLLLDSYSLLASSLLNVI